MRPVLALYVPVLHQGYIKLFREQASEVRDLYILGSDLIKELTYLEPEIRAIDPETIAKMIRTLNIFESVMVITPNNVSELAGRSIITAREEISKRFVEKYLPSSNVAYCSVFLRWDEASVNSSQVPKSAKVSSSAQDIGFMEQAAGESINSSDWWRQVGAVVVKDGTVIMRAHNRHMPSEQMPYIEGDPRDFVEAGTKTELATALHCEQQLVAEAARTGKSLEGSSIYVTVFPCPVCAKLVAYSGIKQCYFAGGHASLDGERILKSKNVELIYIQKP